MKIIVDLDNESDVRNAIALLAEIEACRDDIVVNNKKPEVDWTKIPIDTPVICGDDRTTNVNAFFGLYLKDNKIKFWAFDNANKQKSAQVLDGWTSCSISPDVIIRPEWCK